MSKQLPKGIPSENNEKGIDPKRLQTDLEPKTKPKKIIEDDDFDETLDDSDLSIDEFEEEDDDF